MSGKEFILASFPKSGNTWVRFLIANVYNQIYKEFDEIDYYNIHAIVPELKRQIEPHFRHLPRILKTHELNNDSFGPAILILRNPFDTLFSYYNYLKGEEKKQYSLYDVIKNHKFGITAIVAHTESYVKRKGQLLVTTYEKLSCDPVSELRKICTYIRINVPIQIIQKAVELSSFSKMRETEIRKGRKYGNPDFLFTRKGKVNEGLDVFSNFPEVFEFVRKHQNSSTILNQLYGKIDIK